MIAGAKAFGRSLLTHWVWAVVFVIVIVLFAAKPVARLLVKVPVVGKKAAEVA